jgi:hypothetical protein
MFFSFTDMDLRILNEHDRTSALCFLKRELFRLATFPDNWCHESNPNLTKEKMASAGFFYTGLIDRVQCAFCRVYLDRWGPQDTPTIEHKRHTLNAPEGQFIFCPLMADFPTGNVTRDIITVCEITWNSDIMRFNALINKMPDYAARDNLLEGLIFIQDATPADIIKTQPPKKTINENAVAERGDVYTLACFFATIHEYQGHGSRGFLPYR